MKRYLLCAFLLAPIGNLGFLVAQTVTHSWPTPPPNSYSEAITINLAGDIYVVNDTPIIRKITPGGMPTAALAVLANAAYPSGIANAGSGSLCKANYADAAVSTITADGVITESGVMLASGGSPYDITIDYRRKRTTLSILINNK
jgi:hypothetical protein